MKKSVIFLQILILFSGITFLICSVIFSFPATNDVSLLGLKGIMFLILFVVNTSSHSLYAIEFYYINNKCSNNNCALKTTDGDESINNGYIVDNNNNLNNGEKKLSVSNILSFNIFVLNSSYFLIFSILINILQAAGIGENNKIEMTLTFYSFLIFFVVVFINYLIYNYLLYNSLKKYVKAD